MWEVTDKPLTLVEFIEKEGLVLSSSDRVWWASMDAWRECNRSGGLFPGWLQVTDEKEHHEKMDIVRRYGRYCFWLEQELSKPGWVSDTMNY